MAHFSVEEAQLYRMLTAFLGSENIVPHMSVLAVCGGELPSSLRDGIEAEGLLGWAKKAKCLFTIIDSNDAPRLVVDFEAMADNTIDPERLEYHRIAEPLLQAAGVRFFTITNDEFREMLKPSGNLDLFHYFKGRFEELGFSFTANDESPDTGCSE